MKFSLPFFQSASSPPLVIPQWGTEAVQQVLAGLYPDTVLIDVRQPEEWQTGVIPGARKIALDQLRDHLSELDREKQYILVCRSGNRSQMAAELMVKAGFSRVANYQGGMLAWNRQRLPLEQ